MYWNRTSRSVRHAVGASAAWCMVFFCAGGDASGADPAHVSSAAVGSAPHDSSLDGILRDSGFSGGLIVHVGCGNGRRTSTLVPGDNGLVQGLDSNEQAIEQARQRARSLDLDGRMTFKRWVGGSLPFADSLVNVLLWDQAAGDADRTEILRVLAPRGVAYLECNGEWEQLVKPWPDEIRQWTHFRGDAGGSGASGDTRVGPPRHVQWEAGPRVMRSHEIESGLSGLVTANGRLYTIIDEGPIGITDARFPAQWSLVCRDAFNGVLLWKRSLPAWGWQAWSSKPRENIPQMWLGTRTRPADVDRLMAAEGDVLYATLGFGAPVSAVDGRTGQVLRTYADTDETSELIVLRGVLLVRKERPAASIRAFKADDGTLLWNHATRHVAGRTLAAAGNHVLFHNRTELVALDLQSGEERWRYETQLQPASVIAHGPAALVVQTKTVLAVDIDDGQLLWRSPGVQSRGRYPDLFVVDDLVWSGRPHFHARDIKTGMVVRELELQKVLESGHHRRCYADRATSNYMITGERGSEFLALCDDDHSRHNWLRGPCIHGMLPANGLYYVPPHQCFCYPAIRMDGFFSVASRRESPSPQAGGSPIVRLEHGEAYGKPADDRPAKPDEWPTYRRDAKRSGSVPSEVAGDLQPLWSRQLGGRLTQAVVGGGRAFVAQKDAGTLHCLDFQTGDLLWNWTAAGGIDSPPTLVGGRVLFGSRDGFAYCLRADDGRLVWRFRAAPEDRQVVSHDRLESAWPVHGSLLYLDGLVYGTAGRSGFLDGGITLFALEPASGKLVHETRLEGPHPDISQPSPAFHDEGHRADLLTTDGQYIYMGRTILDRTLEVVEPERISLVGTQRGDQLEYRVMPGMRLVATGGFLDDTFWNRTWWMHSYVWPGFHYAQQAPKSGQLLVFNDAETFTVKHYTTRNRHSPMLFPGSGYLLFADANDNEPLFYRGQGEPAPIQWEPELPETTKWSIYQDAAVDKGPGFTRSRPALWTSWVDVRAEAMVLAGRTLFIAGTPDVVPEDDPLAALQGRMGGLLKAVSATDGSAVAQHPLAARPVFDGLSAAHGRLVICLQDGSVVCMNSTSPSSNHPMPEARP